MKLNLKGLAFLALILASPAAAQGVDPVEYVRICDAFGTGFYYIPGTDTCLQVGGRVRAEAHYVDRHIELSDEYPDLGQEEESEDSFNEDADRSGNKFTTLAKGYVSLDARTQTEFGLVQTYLSLSMTTKFRETLLDSGDDPTDREFFELFGIEYFDSGETFPDIEYAVVQISTDFGIYTAGHTDSFFDFWDTYDFGTRLGMDDPTKQTNLFAYTFVGRSGVSATLSLEDPNSSGIAGAERGSLVIAPTSRNLSGVNPLKSPDLVGNIRIDQDWGSAQISGAVRRLNPFEAVFMDEVIVDSLEAPEAFGWAVSGGVIAGVPGTDWEFAAQAGYSEGMGGYVTDVGLDFFTIEEPDSTGALMERETRLLQSGSIRAGLSVPLSPTVTAAVDGSYSFLDGLDFDAFDDVQQEVVRREADFNYWAIAGNLQWRPTHGLMIGTELAYELAQSDVDVIEDDPPTDIFGILHDFDTHKFGGMVRVQRDF